MFNPFAQLQHIKAEVFTSLPAKFRNKVRTEWAHHNRQGTEIECFIEGPAFDRKGNLYIVDIPFGRIFRISPNREWELVVQYDGWPNGMKFHKDGRAFIADYKRGILVLDVNTGKIEPLLSSAYSENFKGANDLHFTSNGDLYFTDQGQTGIADPTGRVYRLKANGDLQRLCDNVPSPNGITISTTEKHIYVAATRSLQIWRLPLMQDAQISKTGVAIQLSGGVGPDGIDMDSENGLVVCHLDVGVWRFDAKMLPTHLVHSDDPKHHHLSNVAYGGPDLKTLYMTDSMSGDVLVAQMPVAGKKLYGLQ
jgi:gluconolactonase